MDETNSLKDSLLTQSWPWSQYETQTTDRQKFSDIWKNAFRDLKHDLRTTRWLRGFGWLGGTVWLSGLIVTLIFISFATLDSTKTACQPDGSFLLHPETYSMWSSSGFFQITLGGGTMSFAQAKASDIAWDIGVGRGGQFLLSFVSWRVFQRYLTVCMEVQPITYQLFRTIFLDTEASLLSTYRTVKSFIWQRRFRSKIAMIFMVLTMIFILLFPTLASAMSGYDANVDAYVLDSDQNLFPFRDYMRIKYVVHDGWRINQTGNYWITYNDSTYEDPVLPGDHFCAKATPCAFISTYVAWYGLGGRKNESSYYDISTVAWENNTVKLNAPVLNISAFTDDGTEVDHSNSSYVLPISWVRGNETVDITWVENNGKCQTVGTYQWGFSFLQLFVCIVLLLMWTVGIYTMWLRAHFTMAHRKRNSNDISGEHRAVLELAFAMQMELYLYDSDLSVLKEKDLRQRVNNELNGGAISYSYANAEMKMYSMRKQLKNWLKNEKWWFTAIFVTSLLLGAVWTGSNEGMILTFGMCAVWLGLFLAICLGTTNGSRILIVLFWSVVSAIAVGSLLGSFS